MSEGSRAGAREPHPPRPTRLSGDDLVAILLAAALASAPAVAQRHYGFRHDPVEWLTTSSDLDAVKLRVLVLKEPRRGDQAVLDAAIAKILAEQQPDGHIGSPRR